MTIGGPLLLNSLPTPIIFQSDVCDLFIVAQTLISFSTLGFVILLSILTLLPTLYKMQLDAMVQSNEADSEIKMIVKKLKHPSFRILHKFNETRSLNILSFCSLILIVSGVFGFLYFLYQNINNLVIGCSISILSISVMIYFITHMLIDLQQNAHYYKINDMDILSEYIDIKQKD